jgi:hypothetical protein
MLLDEEPAARRAPDAGTRWLRRFYVVSAFLLLVAVLAKTKAGVAFVDQATAELPGWAEASVGLVSDCVDDARTWWSRIP